MPWGCVGYLGGTAEQGGAAIKGLHLQWCAVEGVQAQAHAAAGQVVRQQHSRLWHQHLALHAVGRGEEEPTQALHCSHLQHGAVLPQPAGQAVMTAPAVAIAQRTPVLHCLTVLPAVLPCTAVPHLHYEEREHLLQGLSVTQVNSRAHSLPGPLSRGKQSDGGLRILQQRGHPCSNGGVGCGQAGSWAVVQSRKPAEGAPIALWPRCLRAQRASLTTAHTYIHRRPLPAYPSTSPPTGWHHPPPTCRLQVLHQRGQLGAAAQEGGDGGVAGLRSRRHGLGHQAVADSSVLCRECEGCMRGEAGRRGRAHGPHQKAVVQHLVLTVLLCCPCFLTADSH